MQVSYPSGSNTGPDPGFDWEVLTLVVFLLLAFASVLMVVLY